jgi:hypothetical protein
VCDVGWQGKATDKSGEIIEDQDFRSSLKFCNGRGKRL